MNRIPFVLLLLCLFIGCSKREVREAKVKETTYENGQVKERWSDKIVKDGRYESWHPNGTKECDGEYVDGKEQGRWTVWYDNGQKNLEGNYVNGKKEGRWTSWYKDGRKAFEGDYVDGKRQGRWIFWDKNGHKELEDEYVHGVLK